MLYKELNGMFEIVTQPSPKLCLHNFTVFFPVFE